MEGGGGRSEIKSKGMENSSSELTTEDFPK